MLLAGGSVAGAARRRTTSASSRLFLSAAERARPAHVRSALIATLFGSAANVATLAFAAVVCGWLAYARSGCALSVVVAALEVLVISTRCGIILSYRRPDRLQQAGHDEAWLTGFGWLALASSALWGSLCFLALATTHDAVLYAIPILSTVGIAGSVAARNSAVPRLAKSQLVLSLGPILAGCVLADDPDFRVLLLLVPAMAAGLFILIDERNAQLLALIEARYELDRLSHLDAVTDIANRRTFNERLERCLAARSRFALVMVDIDHFKRFNDTFGHPTGDLVLARVATILKSELRKAADLVARYGGEEFAIMIDDVDLRGAVVTAERVRARVEETFARAVAGGRITISLGVAINDASRDADDIVQRADDALYRAKRTGRNRVAVAREPMAAWADRTPISADGPPDLSPAKLRRSG